MDFARIDLSKFEKSEQIEIYNLISQNQEKHNKKCPLIIDLSGPLIKIKTYENMPIKLNSGQKVFITTDPNFPHFELNKIPVIFCDCEILPLYVKPGNNLIIDQNKVILLVQEILSESQFSELILEKSNKIPKSPDLLKMKTAKSESNLIPGKLSEEDKLFSQILFEADLIKPTIQESHKNLEKTLILCEIQYDSTIFSNSPLYFPTISRKTDLNLQLFTENEIADILYWKDKADFITLTQIEEQSDIDFVRKIIGKNEHDIKILAKVQNYVALKNLIGIIEKSDGIIIERFTLGLDLPPAHLVFIQNYIINKCKLYGKPVILTSDIMNDGKNKFGLSPSESADIALAITQGIDGLEFQNPISDCNAENFNEISRICKSAECNLDSYHNYFSLEEYFFPNVILFCRELLRQNKEKSMQDIICSCTINASLDLNVSLILIFTQTGLLSTKISKYKPRANILAVCPSQSIANFCELSYGVNSMILTEISYETEEFSEKILNLYFF